MIPDASSSEDSYPISVPTNSFYQISSQLLYKILNFPRIVEFETRR
jgi:hypothetical protein